MGREVQKCRQFKEGNGVDCGKLAVRRYIWIQWKPCDEYGKMKEGRESLIIYQTHLLSHWRQFAQTGTQQVETKTRRRSKSLPTLSKPRFWSPDPSWPTSVRMIQGQYTSQLRYQSRDTLWPILLRTVQSGGDSVTWYRYTFPPFSTPKAFGPSPVCVQVQWTP